MDTTAEIVEGCLSLLPVPHLQNHFLALKVIWVAAEKVQPNKQQLRVLAYSIARVLQTLDSEHRAAQLLPIDSAALSDLRR
jgi:hypothetical protein